MHFMFVRPSLCVHMVMVVVFFFPFLGDASIYHGQFVMRFVLSGITAI